MSIEESPGLGDPERRGILMETITAVSYLMSGADIVILRHPESVRLTRSFIDLMVAGGMATEIQEISKNLELQEADLVSISPEPNLTIAGEKKKVAEKAAKPKKAAPKPKKEKKSTKTVSKQAAEKVVELRPKAEEEAKAKVEEEAKRKAEEEAKIKAEDEAKKKAEEEVKIKAEDENKKKAEEEAKAKAEEDNKRKAEEEIKKKAETNEKEKEDLQALRLKRAQEREGLEAGRKVPDGAQVTMTPAQEQHTLTDRLTQNLDRIHRRI